MGRIQKEFFNAEFGKIYFIELHDIGVESVDIAKDRVLECVKQGGHGIAEKDMEREWFDSRILAKEKIPFIGLNRET